MSAKFAAGLVLGVIALAHRARRRRVPRSSLVGGEWTMGLAMFGQICLLCLISMLSGDRLRRGVPDLRAGDRPVLRAADRLGALGEIPVLNDAAQWLDTARTTDGLGEHVASAKEWAQLGTSYLLWLGLPLVVGLIRIGRGEIRAA